MPTATYYKKGSFQAATFGSQMCHECALISQSSPISSYYGTGEAQNQWDTTHIKLVVDADSYQFYACV